MLLNLDAGELPDESPDLWAHFDMLNIACGGHAGDTASMTRVVEYCAAHSIAIGAHPSYPDRANFGRRTLDIDPEELHASLVAQLRSLARIVLVHDARVEYAKPHGALYHDASRDPALAVLVVDAIQLALERVTIIGPRGHLASAARAAGLPFAVEGFADRVMRLDGSLVPRSEPNALITSPADAAAQALALASGTSSVDTICVHADTPNSIEIARAVRAVFAVNTGSANAHGVNPASANALAVRCGSTSHTSSRASLSSSAESRSSTTPSTSAESRSATAATSPTATATSTTSSTSAESRSSTTPSTSAESRFSTATTSLTISTSAESRSSTVTTTAEFKWASSRPFEHLGDRAIRFPRPPSVSSRTLARAVRGWRGVVGVVVARHDIAAYFAEPILPASSRDRGAYGNAEDLPRGLRSNIARLAELDDLDGPVREVELRAVYDGPDLDEVARATGLTTDEVISAHVGATYEVDTLGFAPGFAYLVGLDARLHVPRRATPRARVPAGALAIAGEYTAIYPVASPGGWNLIGRVDQPMIDGHRATLALGDRVRFVR